MCPRAQVVPRFGSCHCDAPRMLHSTLSFSHTMYVYFCNARASQMGTTRAGECFAWPGERSRWGWSVVNGRGDSTGMPSTRAVRGLCLVSSSGLTSKKPFAYSAVIHTWAKQHTITQCTAESIDVWATKSTYREQDVQGQQKPSQNSG